MKVYETDSPVIRQVEGGLIYDHQQGDRFLVHGRTTNGHRVNKVYDNPVVPMMLHFDFGEVWLCRGDERHLMRRVGAPDRIADMALLERMGAALN